MKYDFNSFKDLSETVVRQIITGMFRRESDKTIRGILDRKSSEIKYRKPIYKVSDDYIKIGYEEYWDDDIVLVVLYKDRIELHEENKFHPLEIKTLYKFTK